MMLGNDSGASSGYWKGRKKGERTGHAQRGEKEKIDKGGALGVGVVRGQREPSRRQLNAILSFVSIN